MVMCFDYFSTKQHDLSISSRISAVDFLLSNNISAINFFETIYKIDAKQKIVLYHVLDMLIEKRPKYLNDILDMYLNRALSESHESIKRCVSRTIYHQLKHNNKIYNKDQKSLIITTMFDWLINQSLVATRVNAIHVLYFLIDEDDWIKEQLIAIIEQQMLLQEASFLSRGKKILKLIQKQKHHKNRFL